MGKSIKVLIVEDTENDAALLIHALQRGGYDPVCEIMETPEAMADALNRQEWDLVISDYSMPCFSGLDALKLLQERDPDLSFILLTGQVGEEVAVEAMKAGAHDYILKSNRARLIPAVDRELRDTQARRKNRQNEQALQESREHYRLIVETANEGIWQVDEESRTTFVNKKMAEMIGYTIDEMMGQTFYTFMDEERGKAAEANMQRPSQGIGWQLEYKFQRKDGTGLWAIISAAPIFRDDGSYAGAIGMLNDTTERKQAEKELRESEERFRLLFDGSQDAIMTIAPPSWKFTSANPAALKMFGAKDAAEFTALGLWDASPERQPDGRPSADKAKEMIETAMREGSHFFEWTHRRLDGADFPANVLITRVEIAGQAFIQATVRDITAQKQAEDALRESEEKHRHLIENSHDIIYTLTLDGVFTFVSPAWTAFLGHPVTQVVGQPFQPFVHADDVAVCMDYLQTVIETGQRQANVEYRVQHTDGSWRWHTTNGAPLRDKAGTIIGFEGVSRDITERKLAENALRASEEKYRTIFNATGTAAVIVEEDTTISLINSEFETLSGYSKKEIEGKKSWQEFFTEDSLAYMTGYHNLRRSEPDSAPKQYETAFITGKGDIKQVISTVTMIPGTKQSIGFFLDITERKRAEAELRFSEERFSKAFNVCPSTMSISTFPDGRYIDVNEAYIKNLGYRREEVIGFTRSELNIWGRSADLAEAVQILYEQKSFRNLETLIRAKSGELRIGLVSADIFQIGGEDYMLAVFDDITERKQAGAALRESEEQLRRITDNMLDMVCQTDARGIIQYASPSNESVVGYKPEDLLGKPVLNFMHPDDLNRAITTFQTFQAAINASLGGKFEFRFKHADGRYLWVEIVGKPLFDDMGMVAGAIFGGRDITERKMAEEALKQSEEKYRSLIVNLNDVIFTVNAEGYVTYISPVVERFAGYKDVEIIGKPFMHFVHPEDLQGLLESFRRSLSSQIEPFEFRLLRKDGASIYVRSFSRLLAENGQVSLTGVLSDITERKRAEEELCSANHRLAQIIEFLPDATYVVDRDKKVIAWNRAIEEQTQILKEDMLGKGDNAYTIPYYGVQRTNLIDLVLFSDKDPEKHYDYVKRTGKTITIETYAPYAYGGKGGYLWAVAAPLYDINGNVIGAIESIRDVTERKRAEDELLSAHEQLAQIIEFLPDATFVIDSNRRVIAWNRAIEEMTGVGKDDMIGRGDYAYSVPFYGEPRPIMIDLVLDEDSNTALKYENMEKANTTIYAEAYVPCTYQGKGAWLWGTASPLVDGEGNIIGAIESIRDIAERKRAEEELKKHREHLKELVAERTTDLLAVNQELEAFTHSVAHDLRAPLRSISGFSQILLEDYADRLDKQGSEHLERLKASSEHMSHLIEDLLNLSRVTSAALNREQTDLSAMAQSIVADLIKEQPERQAHFDIQEGITVFGDPDLLNIMLQNLLDNAWKFTGKKAETEISFGITIYEGRQAYYVRDNGTGFNMAHAGKLFEPFKRLHSTKEFTGTGIGLASVKRIIRRHGGQIWAEGKVGQGATFYFTL
jgi:PAS domain S-box-containing protein